MVKEFEPTINPEWQFDIVTYLCNKHMSHLVEQDMGGCYLSLA